MLKKLISTLAVFALFFASTAYAGVSIQHRYLGETPSGDQTVVSLEVSVTNTGTGDLTGVELIAQALFMFLRLPPTPCPLVL